MNNDCIFCKIIKGEIPCNKVYENDDVLVFPTIEPVTDGHLLVIPKVHSKNILDINEETLKKIITVTKSLAKKTVEKSSATSVNILHAAGKDAQQSVFHFHIHIVPRYENDGLDLWFRNKL